MVHFTQDKYRVNCHDLIFSLSSLNTQYFVKICYLDSLYKTRFLRNSFKQLTELMFDKLSYHKRNTSGDLIYLLMCIFLQLNASTKTKKTSSYKTYLKYEPMSSDCWSVLYIISILVKISPMDDEGALSYRVVGMAELDHL